MGGSIGKGFKDVFSKVADPYGLYETPKKPKIKKPPKVDEVAARKKADLVKRVRQQRAIAAFGFSDTRLTGQKGLGSSGPGNKPTLLGT
jgi:hypothetical protein